MTKYNSLAITQEVTEIGSEVYYIRLYEDMSLIPTDEYVVHAIHSETLEDDIEMLECYLNDYALELLDSAFELSQHELEDVIDIMDEEISQE